MEVFRISKEAYSKELSSSGTANRWNLRGQHVIYTGSSRSLASLELIVHKGAVFPTEKYKVMIISIADDDYLIKQLQIKDLPANWRTFSAYPILQRIGSQWITNQESLVLKVPSAVIPFEYNYMINTEHPLFSSKVHLVRTEEYFWDSRLLDA
jgi:RES domain-containing protein